MLERKNVVDFDCQMYGCSLSQDCTKIVKLYSPQMDRNKHCEAHRCLDSYKF